MTMPTDIAFMAVVAVSILVGAICYRIGRHDGYEDAIADVEAYARKRAW